MANPIVNMDYFVLVVLKKSVKKQIAEKAVQRLSSQSIAYMLQDFGSSYTSKK